jgi:hypothetical protein
MGVLDAIEISNLACLSYPHYLLKACFISTRIIALFGIENHFFPVYILFLEE